jgi:hypothetical protein
VPRGRPLMPDGEAAEWQSQLLPRYARRTSEVDAALIGLYLAGTNTRRVQLTLKPLLRCAPLSKSAASRVVAGLKDQYATWRTGDLKGEALKLLYLDAIWLRVRLAKKIEKLPVAVAIGVREDGAKVLLGLWAYASERLSAWGGVLGDLVARGLPIPAPVVIDGGKGLRGAVTACWPKVAVQRCTVHKLRNLEVHAPKRLHDELRQDYREIVYAKDERAVGRAWLKLTTKCVPGGSREPGGRRPRVADLLPLPGAPVEGTAHHQHRRARERGVPSGGQDVRGAALGGQRTAVAVRPGGVWPVAVPDTRRLPGARSSRPDGRVTMTQVSRDLEIAAVQPSMEAASRGDHIGRGATLLLNRLPDRIHLRAPRNVDGSHYSSGV